MRSLRPQAALIGPALVLCAVYWGEVAVHLGAFARATYANADAVAGPVISGSFDGLGREHAALGNIAWYTTLWFGLAARQLPFDRELWIVMPYLLALATAALVVRGVARAAGSRAALVAAVPVVCLSPVALWWSSTLVSHSTTWFAMAVLGLYATTLARSADRVSRRRDVLLGAVVAVVAGTNAASDYLLFACGIVPLAVTGVAVERLGAHVARAGGAAARGIGVALAASVVAGVTWLVMASLHVHAGGKTNGPSLVNPSKLEGNVKVLWRIFLALADVRQPRRGFEPAKELRVLCFAAAAAGVGAAIAVAVRTLRRHAARDPRDVVRLAWVAFWVSGTLLLLVAYLVAGYPTLEPEFEASRYLVGIVYACTAVAAVVLARAGARTHGAAVAAVTILALTGTIHIARVGISNACCAELEGNHPSPALARRIASVARSYGMKRGYAGYWYSLALTWFSKRRLDVYPIDRCGAHLERLCASFYNHLSSWYHPGGARRSFFLASEPRYVRSAKSFGRPLRTYRLSSDLTLYVYDYDIATRIGPR